MSCLDTSLFMWLEVDLLDFPIAFSLPMLVQSVLTECCVPKKYFWKEKQTLSSTSVDISLSFFGHFNLNGVISKSSLTPMQYCPALDDGLGCLKLQLKLENQVDLYTFLSCSCFHITEELWNFILDVFRFYHEHFDYKFASFKKCYFGMLLQIMCFGNSRTERLCPTFKPSSSLFTAVTTEWWRLQDWHSPKSTSLALPGTEVPSLSSFSNTWRLPSNSSWETSPHAHRLCKEPKVCSLPSSSILTGAQFNCYI